MPKSPDLFDQYLHSMQTADPAAPRRNLEEFLEDNGQNVLPKRSTKDIRPLVDFLTRFVFKEDNLKLGEEPINDRFEGMQAVILGDRLIRELGPDFGKEYHFRDWTVAVEDMLKERGFPRTPNFGLEYRVGMNWDGNGGMFLNIKSDVLEQCTESAMLLRKQNGRLF
jgi:hypothetical protein